MIPKLAHRIWLDEPMPERFEGFWRRFRELHPDWELVTWDRSGMLDWMSNWSVFTRCTTWAGKSDVARYEILARYGGVYLDTDVEPLRSFDDLLGAGPFVAWEDQRLLCPTVMGAPPQHPAAQALVDGLAEWFARREGKPPNQATGPYFLTAMWRARTDVRLLPPVTFYPVHWSEKRNLGGPYPAASYAVHHWAAGWLPDGPPQRV
jgi:mannosyltransferase OCH1-like enzyme